ncbi:PH domain-containing protein [Streptomyces inhibens]|uniref:PH domain-containing protein n=1 Tax=Streptomyces inhibens TaxID=2293571 RepID=UPI001EE6CE94|nr:PH domain-containing protein [Streptomyces inhibens]UKY47527.1 PH domain-containing protein [Streptomyces inhibens]
MSGIYRDRWIECTSDSVRIRAYYFPWGTKTIPYRSLRSVRSVEMGLFSGQARIWGTANPRYWASLDPGRPSKKVGLILDLGRFVHPFITPDDPEAVKAVIRERANLGPTGDDSTRGPAL